MFTVDDLFTIKYFSIYSTHSGLTRVYITLKTSMKDSASDILRTTQLIKIKCKAIRAGVWFKALPRIDRVLVDLTIKVTESIRSSYLARNIFAVVSKLEGLLESSVLRSLRLFGRPLAQKISSTAQGWGNVSAKGWANDSSFAFFLAVMHTNG